MKKEDLIQTLKNVLAKSPKRKFKQSVELIINLKDLNLKKPEEKVDTFLTLPNSIGKTVKICALIGPELKEQASKFCDSFILEPDFAKYEGQKKEIKKLAQQYDYFIAQAPLMAKIAKVFGRFFGPRGKMPNPKAGCVVPPNAGLEPLVKKLKQTVRLQIKNAPIIQVVIGKEDAGEDVLINNANAVYTHLVHALPNEEHNVREVLLKLTMGPVFNVGKPAKSTPKTETAKTMVKEELKEAIKEPGNKNLMNKVHDGIKKPEVFKYGI